MKVSAVAARLKITVPVASQYLRALESRSVLQARRIGREVEYRWRMEEEGGHKWAAGLHAELRRNKGAVTTVFRLCTAFTHPRRIEIYRSIRAGSRTALEVRSRTRIPYRTLGRHLGKLEARGFVRRRRGFLEAAAPPDRFGRALAGLASGRGD